MNAKQYLGIMESLAGHTILQKPKRKKTPIQLIKSGNLNKKCNGCGHKNKKCVCK